MGRVSTCQKNCKTIDLRGAQVNEDIHCSQSDLVILLLIMRKIIYNNQKLFNLRYAS